MMLERWNACCLITSYCFNPIADCGAPAPPVNGFLQPHTNTTEGSVVMFQCDPGFVQEGEMTAVCESDGQWTPDTGDVTCSPKPTQTFTEASILTASPSYTPDFTGPGESQLLHKIQWKHNMNSSFTVTWLLTLTTVGYLLGVFFRLWIPFWSVFRLLLAASMGNLS